MVSRKKMQIMILIDEKKKTKPVLVDSFSVPWQNLKTDKRRTNKGHSSKTTEPEDGERPKEG